MSKKVVYLTGFTLILITIVVLFLLYNKNPSTITTIFNNPVNAPVQNGMPAAQASANQPPVTPPPATGGYQPNNYDMWAAYMIKKLSDTGNYDIANQLKAQLNLIVTGNTAMGTTNYSLDTAVFYNKTVPDLPIVVNTGFNPATSQQVFMNTASIFALVGMNVVANNTLGQAIGQRQAIIRSAWQRIQSNSDANNIPQSTASLVYYYNCAISMQWPVGNGGAAQIPANDAQVIINDVVAVAGAAAKVAAIVA